MECIFDLLGFFGFRIVPLAVCTDHAAAFLFSVNKTLVRLLNTALKVCYLLCFERSKIGNALCILIEGLFLLALAIMKFVN